MARTYLESGRTSVDRLLSDGRVVPGCRDDRLRVRGRSRHDLLIVGAGIYSDSGDDSALEPLHKRHREVDRGFRLSLRNDNWL
jgi:hypothetical protein